jgi:hypothetical protein
LELRRRCLQRPDAGPVRPISGAAVARLQPLIESWREEVIRCARGASGQVVTYADASVFVWKKGVNSGARPIDVDLTCLVLKKLLRILIGNDLTLRWRSVRSACSASGHSVALARVRSDAISASGHRDDASGRYLPCVGRLLTVGIVRTTLK